MFLESDVPTSVALGAYFETFVKEQVGAGRFNNASEVVAIHLFVREHKLQAGKAAPFVYFGEVRYRSHTGSAPMSVVLDVGDA